MQGGLEFCTLEEGRPWLCRAGAEVGQLSTGTHLGFSLAETRVQWARPLGALLNRGPIASSVALGAEVGD